MGQLKHICSGPDWTPVVIVGAPRSGTNMLREILCTLPDVATWPCDEINYIWRHGNVRHDSDVFTPDMARPAVTNSIRRQFDWVARNYQAEFVVEKTCANSLRVPFVDAVLPEAKYLFIRRDGLDAVGSAMKRWKAELDIPYLMRKARFVPLSDLPYYGGRYLWNRFYRLVSREERLAFWGPQLEGMDELLVKHPLDEVCALQWQACVDKAADAFAAMPTDRWLEIAYEDFVREPEREFARVIEFLGIESPSEQVKQAVAGVRADSIGKGRAALNDDALQRLEGLVHQTLARYGYV
ncbi:sulfotransferase family protein [Thiohalophilus thiocyanatoxydans]|uniref:Sulfotransferase family protein n=1 Tax=Thiohalophilus thiocyanatoxydans TaxID=381308 RepID=A0A4R8IZ14_9GAMM|nr:sulfotransferase [Thiohalophilus thiocyanatoxydans]TDY02693.1 sulfotransferase family protein [Thiohalophilus thiocyanatoxydans]